MRKKSDPRRGSSRAGKKNRSQSASTPSSSAARGRWAGARRLGLALGVLASTIALFPRIDGPSEFEGFTEGRVAPVAVVAPFDFDVLKSDAVVEAERRRAREGVAAYFRKDDAVEPRVLEAFDAFVAEIERVERSKRDTLEILMQVRQLGVELSDRAQRALLRPETRSEVVEATREFLEQVLTSGLADTQASERIRGSMRHMLLTGQSFSPVQLREVAYTQQRANRYAQEVSQARFQNDPVAAEAFRALLGAFLEPNIRHDQRETQRIEDAQVSLVTAVERRVLRDEMIIDAHRIVTPEAMRALEALRRELSAREDGAGGFRAGLAIAGRALLTAAILVFSIVYLRLHRPRVYANDGKLVLLAVTATMIVVLAGIVLNVLEQPWLLIPVAAGAMIVSLLVDAQLGVFFTLVAVVIVALNAHLGLDFVSGSLIGGFTGVYAVQRVRHRSEVFRALLLVSMANIFTVAALGMMSGDIGFSIVTGSGWGLLNAFLSTAIAIFLIPLLEVTCRVTTDLTLLELSDLNRPLLRRLMLEAPGTYHHSMVMGTMAEAACERIGANSLLGRVQCYYHDIGKLTKPEYFIENIALNPQARNPHDRLTPSMSCLILESHVREGVQLAREHKLPEVLIDAIREHHGTSEMTFFYEKARALDPSVEREEFRYPGPKPHSNETAVVMLADGVEAASRVFSDPRPSRIRQLVRRILESRIEAGELDACGLTLADLAKINDAFVHVLTGIFHGRVKYPSDAESVEALKSVDRSGAKLRQPGGDTPETVGGLDPGESSGGRATG